MEMSMDQFILYDARPSSSENAFREIFSFADIPDESPLPRDDISTSGIQDTSNTQKDLSRFRL